MSSAAQIRLLGYSVILAIHGYTTYDILARIAVTSKDPIVADYVSVSEKYFTILLFSCQIFYAAFGLSCDVLSLRSGGKNAGLLRTMNAFRQKFFSSIIFPCSLLVPTLFWPIYYFDSDLIFPPISYKILSWPNNHVLHTFVAFFALWEVIVLKINKQNHLLNVLLMNGTYAVYIMIVMVSFYQRGKFVYPFLDAWWGTFGFPSFWIYAGVAMNIYYHLQWPINKSIWATKTEKLNGKKQL